MTILRISSLISSASFLAFFRTLDMSSGLKVTISDLDLFAFFDNSLLFPLPSSLFPVCNSPLTFRCSGFKIKLTSSALLISGSTKLLSTIFWKITLFFLHSQSSISLRASAKVLLPLPLCWRFCSFQFFLFAPSISLQGVYSFSQYPIPVSWGWPVSLFNIN